MYTVYCHTNLTNGKKYVGITKKTPRARWANGAGYNTQTTFKRAIDKYGWDGFSHTILFSDLDQEEAQWLERELIRRFDTQAPNGYNLADGGGTGFKHSPEAVEKIRVAKLGDKNPMYKRDFTAEHRRKISEAERGEKHYRYGKHLSDESKEKISAHRGYAVRCVETGVVYPSAKKASEAMGLGSFAHILDACSGRFAQYKGYHWEYAYPDAGRYGGQNKKRKPSAFRTPVVAVNLTDNNEIEFESVSAAERFFNSRHISDALNGKRKQIKGYSFYRREEVIGSGLEYKTNI